MSEEEKKAIEEIRKIRDRYLHTFCDELTILLNLIKKQQKEIDELKKDNLYKAGYMHGCNDTSKFNDKNFIRKDKIKDKIEELKEMEKTALTQTSRDIARYKYEILELLMEE